MNLGPLSHEPTLPTPLASLKEVHRGNARTNVGYKMHNVSYDVIFSLTFETYFHVRLTAQDFSNLLYRNQESISSQFSYSSLRALIQDAIGTELPRPRVSNDASRDMKR